MRKPSPKIPFCDQMVCCRLTPSSDATEYFWTFVAPKRRNIQWWELYGLVGKSLTFCMYFIARLWPHILYFSCIFSIIWPNLCHDDLDGKILHLQNSRRSLSQSMPHFMILRFFAASSSSNSTLLTSILSQNHGPSSGSSTNLKNVKFGQRLSETQYSDFDGWTRRMGRQLSRERHIWQWWRRCCRRWEGVRHRGGGGGSRTAQVSIAQTQSSIFSTQSSMVEWSRAGESIRGRLSARIYCCLITTSGVFPTPQCGGRSQWRPWWKKWQPLSTLTFFVPSGRIFGKGQKLVSQWKEAILNML